ncbi:MAG: glutamine--fructose-6-phosphate transaminase (isomerizing) [Thermaerobacter sp.]|nr:glutamine--fructose-6-phosphate transaminase (isomerizing) [Thermaerobacter sp.]
MCGIVGYIGPQEALPILLEGLERLEYRGYDSAGVAVLGAGGDILVAKRAGRIADLRQHIGGAKLPGRLGIGHTRWATHGRPSDENAHPHFGCDGRYAIVHNGIIENYAELRQELSARGHVFRSETDTEVVAHLLEEASDLPLLEALRQVTRRLQGSYALAAISRDEPGALVAAREQSPLVVGVGEGEQFVASDIPAILRHTRQVLILEDGECARLTAEKAEVFNRDGSPSARQRLHVAWDVHAAEKGGHAHFMIKEILEQPQVFRETTRGRIDVARGKVLLPEVEGLGLERARRLHVVACGTSYHAGLVGKALLEGIARVETRTEIGSEFRYQDPLVEQGDVLIAVSQSGETADTIAALREGRRRGARTLAVTNVRGSSLDREADAVLPTLAGPEVAVASSKAYTSQILTLTLLALHLAQLRGKEVTKELLQGVTELPAKADALLAQRGEIEALAGRIAEAKDIFYIGRGVDFAVALEGQLKLKEISYIHAEALPAGELKHGTLALIEPGVPVIALCTQSRLREKTISNMTEVRARGAHVIAIGQAHDEELALHADEVLRIPDVAEVLSPALSVLPLQLLAYYAAVARGNDVDKPRNLAKSVTVE